MEGEDHLKVASTELLWNTIKPSTLLKHLERCQGKKKEKRKGNARCNSHTKL